MKESIQEIKENWIYYLVGFILLLFIAGITAFVIFLAFLTALSSM